MFSSSWRRQPWRRARPTWSRARTPTPGAPAFVEWVKLVRSLRRLSRLRELAAPEVIIENEVRIASRLWQVPGVRDLASWPTDLVAIAAGLGLA